MDDTTYYRRQAILTSLEGRRIVRRYRNMFVMKDIKPILAFILHCNKNCLAPLRDCLPRFTCSPIHCQLNSTTSKFMHRLLPESLSFKHRLTQLFVMALLNANPSLFVSSATLGTLNTTRNLLVLGSIYSHARNVIGEGVIPNTRRWTTSSNAHWHIHCSWQTIQVIYTQRNALSIWLMRYLFTLPLLILWASWQSRYTCWEDRGAE